MMNSGCVAGCLDADTPVRPTYVNLYKWPESDAEFVRSMASGKLQQQQRVVDSYSCRQMYLRSYTFCRKESVQQKTKKCFGRVKSRVVCRRQRKRRRSEKKTMTEKITSISCAAFFSIFHRLLACTATVDVVDHL
ncbi:hypothetical protein AMTRI_Chr08g205320 [Amborella trichopoda]|uniref:Uncharacterized protein n=1 Tax=Amborella trichopoda TaxID=13333 RepID=W1PWT8_AMBTC|nr:uncharacterized protein LOC18440476 [Amborella trichopoda]ERN12261.1 hypothetical protein AMTR_s00034p00232170 [Amborella trichopoda]|eukprot:XP_006850680.3 uncharacterized protein LOC18440476 [Amborella trichopoda]